MMTDERTIGSKIKIWRAKKDMTQDELAKRADIPYPTLAKIESGAVKNPSIETVYKLVQGLDITVDELINS